MTLSQLQHTYNFHDCDIFIPFKANQNDITVTFELAKHLQYDEFKSQYSELIKSKECYLLITVKFSNCTKIQAKEWTFDYSSGSKPKRINEKSLLIEQIDREMFLYTTSMSDENGIYFLFTDDPDKGTEIIFSCECAEVVEERFVDQEKYDKIMDGLA